MGGSDPSILELLDPIKEPGRLAACMCPGEVPDLPNLGGTCAGILAHQHIEQDRNFPIRTDITNFEDFSIDLQEIRFVGYLAPCSDLILKFGKHLVCSQGA